MTRLTEKSEGSIDLNALKPDEAFLTHLGKNVWLMDDHRWAFIVWERCRSKPKYCLVHADQHWDGVYDFHDDPEGEQALIAANIDCLEDFVADNDRIRCDSFIAPAVRRGLFKEVHFFCTEDDGNDIGLDEKLLTSSATTQFVHQTIAGLASQQFECPLIFDLCLDLFNRSGDWETGSLWSDAEVTDFLKSVEPLLQAAEIVTVSLSFGYSGTEEDTRRLAHLVCPRIMASRSKH